MQFFSENQWNTSFLVLSCLSCANLRRIKQVVRLVGGTDKRTEQESTPYWAKLHLITAPPPPPPPLGWGPLICLTPKEMQNLTDPWGNPATFAVNPWRKRIFGSLPLRKFDTKRVYPEGFRGSERDNPEDFRGPQPGGPVIMQWPSTKLVCIFHLQIDVWST